MSSSVGPDADLSLPSARTDDSLLPWRTSHRYGGWMGSERVGLSDAPSGEVPVVFVHGKGKDADDWKLHINQFTLNLRAYEPSDLYAITFRDPISRHDDMSKQLDEFVRNVRRYTGHDRVDVVAHSLGVTGVRYWMHDRDRYDWVRKFVGVAGANHGIPPLKLVNLKRLDEPERTVSRNLLPPQVNPNGILSTLNRNETPGDIQYYTIRGQFDRYFVGNTRSPCLEGAERNIRLFLTHNGVRIHPGAVTRLYRLLRD